MNSMQTEQDDGDDDGDRKHMVMKMEAMEIRSSDDFDTNESPYCPLIRSCCKYYMIAMLLAAFGAAVLYSCTKALRRNAVSGDELLKSLDDVNLNVFAPELVLPPELVNSGKYSGGDFENALGITPPFWGKNETCIYGKCQKLWGPCFAEARPIWEKETIYHETPLSGSKMPDPDDLSGYCRPGFLIIGQGKCGTSSLYHYLNGHPRVLPAKEKQIHYFKYFTRYPIKWYLSHFPSTGSFLGQGAIMTGEASPGYLPYPDVAALVHKLMLGTKIICIGRHPLERAYSSYIYNYVDPAIVKMRAGKVRNITRDQPDEYYIQWLHSFEDMMRAELALLKKCLSPTGIGITGAESKWGNEPWGAPIYKRRKKQGAPPLVDIDGQCYGGFISTAVPRLQWVELAAKHPEKFLNVPNLHLTQAMIGRSLYVYPLEWWYEMFDEGDLFFLCTEDMTNLSGEPLNLLAQHLGLSSFDFSGVVSQGAYNVGEHQGYDEVTTWDTVQSEEEEKKTELNATSPIEEIPVSAEFRAELLAFFRPHNERLFKMIGRRCNWDS